MTQVERFRNEWKITITTPAQPAWYFLWIFWRPERKDTYIGDCTVWHHMESGGRPGTLMEGRLSDILRHHQIKEGHSNEV